MKPYAVVQLQSFHTPSYSERDLNGGGFALRYTEHDASRCVDEAGARFDIKVLLDNGMEIEAASAHSLGA